MIHLRPAAVEELKRLLRPQRYSSNFIRLHLQPGGCAEWTYQLSPTPSVQAEDTAFNCGEIQVLVANQLLPYLQNLTIDYAEDLMGGGFRFVNPQAQQTCGCGNSFSVTPGSLLEDCSSHPAPM